MSELTLSDVLDLCAEFKQTAEAQVAQDPELQATALQHVGPHLEDIMNITIDVNTAAASAILSGYTMETLTEHPEIQQLSVRMMEVMAKISAELLTTEQIWDAMPEGLRGNQQAADILKENGAEIMAQIVVKAPQP